jgi:enamine deaminase RidA (YjgF/YER057c/UK114 family)
VAPSKQQTRKSERDRTMSSPQGLESEHIDPLNAPQLGHYDLSDRLFVLSQIALGAKFGLSFACAGTEHKMTGSVEQKLASLGIVLHSPPSPVANYVPFVRSGNLLTVSGQVCYAPDGKLIAKGKLGAGVSLEQGVAAARGCAINLLAQVKAATGDLDKVVRVVRLGGFINSAPDFLDGPKVMNGASDLMVEVFGEKGRHARTTVGVAALPSDAAVEVEGLFEIV